MKKLIIGLDFDDTIVECDFPTILGLKPHAKEVINSLYDDGHYLIVFTCRDSMLNNIGNSKFTVEESVEMAQLYLWERGVHVHTFNQQAPQSLIKYGNDTRKISADVYYDDKAAGGFPDWLEFHKIIQEMAQ